MVLFRDLCRANRFYRSAGGPWKALNIIIIGSESYVTEWVCLLFTTIRDWDMFSSQNEQSCSPYRNTVQTQIWKRCITVAPLVSITLRLGIVAVKWWTYLIRNERILFSMEFCTYSCSLIPAQLKLDNKRNFFLLFLFYYLSLDCPYSQLTPHIQTLIHIYRANLFRVGHACSRNFKFAEHGVKLHKLLYSACSGSKHWNNYPPMEF